MLKPWHSSVKSLEITLYLEKLCCRSCLLPIRIDVWNYIMLGCGCKLCGFFLGMLKICPLERHCLPAHHSLLSSCGSPGLKHSRGNMEKAQKIWVKWNSNLKTLKSHNPLQESSIAWYLKPALMELGISQSWELKILRCLIIKQKSGTDSKRTLSPLKVYINAGFRECLQ